MSLARKAMRHAVADRLRNAIPSVGRRVFAGRATPLQRAELPAITVHTLDTACEVATTAPLIVFRNVDLVISIVLADTDNAADRADEIAALVDALIYLDDTFGDRFEKLLPQSQNMRLEGTAENTVAVLEYKFECVARESLPDANNTLNDLLEVDTKYHLQPTDNQVDAHDNQTLES